MRGHYNFSRRAAFGIHLTASLVIFFSLLGVLVLLWYPGPIFSVEGGWKGIRIVALVDVVLGPLLTLVLFKPGKPGLKFDMSMIVLFQVSALAWGIWTLYQARPVLMVFADESFRTVSYAQLADLDKDGRISAQWVGDSLTKVYVDLPRDPIEFANLLEKSRKKGNVPLQLMADRYEPLDKAWDSLIGDSLDVEDYVSHKASWQESLQALLAKLHKKTGELVFLPYVGRYERAILVADKASKVFVAALEVPYDPSVARQLSPREVKPEQADSGREKPTG